jgi:hypothetical protein
VFQGDVPWGRGEHYHLLADRLAVDDSVVTFNWDLLMDQEFIEEKAYRQYGNFLHSTSGLR